MKRSSGAGARRGSEDTGAKLERQDLWDELRKRVEADADGSATFSPGDISVKLGVSEAAVAKALLTLAYERLLEKADTNIYRFATSFREVNQADFNRALAAKIDAKRQQDWLEIERLKRNNDEMRRRLRDAVAERDRYRALLVKHGIDPGDAAVVVQAAPEPAPAPLEPPPVEVATGAAQADDEGWSAGDGDDSSSGGASSA